MKKKWFWKCIQQLKQSENWGKLWGCRDFLTFFLFFFKSCDVYFIERICWSLFSGTFSNWPGRSPTGAFVGGDSGRSVVSFFSRWPAASVHSMNERAQPTLEEANGVFGINVLYFFPVENICFFTFSSSDSFLAGFCLFLKIFV